MDLAVHDPRVEASPTTRLLPFLLLPARGPAVQRVGKDDLPRHRLCGESVAAIGTTLQESPKEMLFRRACNEPVTAPHGNGRNGRRIKIVEGTIFGYR